MIKLMYRHLGTYKKFAILGPICITIDVACEVALPAITAYILDTLVPAGDTQAIFKMGGLMVVLALIALTAGACNIYLSATAAQGMGTNLRKRLFDKIQDFTFANIDNFSTASLVTRVTSDVNNIQLAALFSLRLLVRCPIMLIASFLFTFMISPELSFILIAVIAILLIFVGIMFKISNPLFHQLQVRLDKMVKTVQENLMGIRVVKAFVRGEQQTEKYVEDNSLLRKVSIKASAMLGCSLPFMFFAFNIATVLIVWNGGQLVGAGSLGSGELISFINYISQIMLSFIMLSIVFIMVARARASADRIIEVLETKPDLADPESEEDPKVNSGNVEFDNVWFKYNLAAEEYTLQNIQITVKQGQVIAIVGSTGTSKTTLVSLIPRLYDVTHGAVRVDGRDVRDYKIQTLRDAVGVVLQKNVLFSGTIKENILWGYPEAAMEQVEEAAKAAQAHEFIMSFPQGYDTWIEQGGSNVSGGQRQRLCIARAMIKKPHILILDDSTSAVDSATEAKIRESFYTDLKETTVFIIAQRISSVRDADQIIVMDEGKVAGVGTHETLMENNFIYQEINQSQQEGVMG